MTLKQIVQGLLVTALIGVILTVYALDKIDLFSLKEGFTLDFNFDAFSLENDKNAKFIKEQKNFPIKDAESLVFKSQSTPINILFEERQDVEVAFEGYYKASKNYKPPTLKVFENGTEKGAEITTPPAVFTMYLNTDFKLTVKLPLSYKNKLQVTSSSGNLKLPKVDLDTLVLETTSGDINAEEINSEIFQMVTSSGTMGVTTIYSKQLIAESTSGNITLGDASSESAKIETSSGTVNVEQATGDVKISSTSGNIQVSKGEAVTRYQVDSSSGTVTLDGLVGGSIIETTSGNIEVAMVSIEEEITIESSSGTVTVNQTKELNYDLSISSSSGDIDVSMPVTVKGNQKEHDLNGTVGSGGKNLKIKTTSGNIELND